MKLSYCHPITCLLLICALVGRSRTQICVTDASDVGPGGLACVLPFKVGRKSYSACTRDLDPEARKWCSLQV